MRLELVLMPFAFKTPARFSQTLVFAIQPRPQQIAFPATAPAIRRNERILRRIWMPISASVTLCGVNPNMIASGNRSHVIRIAARPPNASFFHLMMNVMAVIYRPNSQLETQPMNQ